MEHRKIHHIAQESQFSRREIIDQFMENNDRFATNDSTNHITQQFFREAREKIVSSGGTNSDLFSQILKKKDEHFAKHMMPMTNASIGFDTPHGLEFTRSTSADSGWISNEQVGNQPLTSVQKVPVSQFPPGFLPSRHVFPRFGSFGGFPKFQPLSTSEFMNGESVQGQFWNGNTMIHMSRSTMSYHSHSSSYVHSNSETALQLYADSESDSDDEDLDSVRALSIAPSEDETCSIDTCSGKVLAIEAPPAADPRKERAYRIASELLLTEESYVKVLHLIDQVFHFRVDQENRAHSMFPQETIPQMFSNIKSIFKFHNEFLLPQLKDRMSNWEQEPRIGDIMKNFAPFLKMYTEYVKNFNNAMNLINAFAVKNRRFADIMNEVHKTEECGGLTLTHHMLCPIQRIPRYEMLLKDYLKKLPDDSPDRKDTEKALHLVSTAANHANEMMKKIDKFKQLLELQENISGVVDLVSPTRELLKEGKIIKISARSGDHQERYLYLFSDILFLCSPRLLPNRVISGPTFRLRAKFQVDNMQWCEGDNLETTNTFYIRDNNKNVELYTQTAEEKAAWRDAFALSIQELLDRKSSLKIGADGDDLGKRSPKLIKVDGITKCMECGSTFSVMKRKHHCRACGLVFCSKCSNYKFPLPFEDYKICRICKNCHQILSRRSVLASPDKSSDTDSVDLGKENINMSFMRDKGVLEVSADATSVHSGYLMLKIRGKTWVQRWFSLHPDFVLYSFVNHNDQRAMTATPVPGFTVAKVTSIKGESLHEKEKIFKMFHSKKTYYFHANSKEECDSWVTVLQMAAQAELPSPGSTVR